MGLIRKIEQYFLYTLQLKIEVHKGSKRLKFEVEMVFFAYRSTRIRILTP